MKGKGGGKKKGEEAVKGYRKRKKIGSGKMMGEGGGMRGCERLRSRRMKEDTKGRDREAVNE